MHRTQTQSPIKQSDHQINGLMMIINPTILELIVLCLFCWIEVVSTEMKLCLLQIAILTKKIDA